MSLSITLIDAHQDEVPATAAVDVAVAKSEDGQPIDPDDGVWINADGVTTACDVDPSGTDWLADQPMTPTADNNGTVTFTRRITGSGISSPPTANLSLSRGGLALDFSHTFTDGTDDVPEVLQTFDLVLGGYTSGTWSISATGAGTLQVLNWDADGAAILAGLLAAGWPAGTVGDPVDNTFRITWASGGNTDTPVVTNINLGRYLPGLSRARVFSGF